MPFFKSFTGFLGGLILSFSITFIFAIIFLSNFAAQETQMDSILDKTFTLLIVEDYDTISSSLHDAPELQEFFAQCDAGTISADDCAITVDNPYLSSYFTSAKEGIKEQLYPIFRNLDPYMQNKTLFLILSIVFFLLGSFFLFFSLNYNKFIFFRKICGKIGFQCFFAFIIVFFLLRLQKQDIISLLQGALTGAPDVIFSFASSFLIVFIEVLFQVFFYPLLILMIIFLGLWISLWIYIWIIARRNNV